MIRADGMVIAPEGKTGTALKRSASPYFPQAIADASERKVYASLGFSEGNFSDWGAKMKVNWESPGPIFGTQRQQYVNQNTDVGIVGFYASVNELFRRFEPEQSKK